MGIQDTAPSCGEDSAVLGVKNGLDWLPMVVDVTKKGVYLSYTQIMQTHWMRWIGLTCAAIVLIACTEEQLPGTQPVTLTNPNQTAQRANAQAITAFETFMDAAVENDHFSGTVLVARDGAPIFSKSYGMANYELNAPFTPDTKFNIGSVAKQFTSLSIMQLQEKGRLNVNDPICNYLNTCPPAWQPITIRHLLTHTSGIPNYSRASDWDEVGAVKNYMHGELVALFRNLSLKFTPGEEHRYSNSGYQLLALIIERVSGESYGAYLRDHIFAPLGMRKTQYNNSRSLVPNRATGYYSLGTSFINVSLHSPTIKFGDAGIFSTVGDLLIWDQALYTGQLISRDSMTEMLTPYLKNYAYGWRVKESFGRPEVNHSGDSTGFSAFIMRFINDRFTVIVLSNSKEANAGRVGYGLSAINFGAPYEFPAKTLLDILWNVAMQDGVAAATGRYLELKRTQPSIDNFEEDETLNDLGYSLYEAQLLEEAQRVFDFTIEQFPRSAYSYDGLADIAASQGNYAKAIQHFEKSLRIEPDNEYAVLGLERARELRSIFSQ